MVSMRRRFWMVLLAALTAGGLACGKGGSSTSSKTGTTGDKAKTEQSGGTAGGDSAKPATNGGSAAQDAQPGVPGQNCKECQSANDAVKKSDADGFEFETGEAEAGRIQAGDPKPGDEKPSTFDAGDGMTGTTGSGSWKPKS
jgi:hypothetical protein